MRTHVVISLVGLATLAGGCARSALPPRATVPVAVAVDCSGSDVVFAVRPWHLELAEGDEVVWNLADATQSIEIRKQQYSWPFRSNRFDGTQADPPTARAMKPDQAGKRFRYSISVTCQGAEGARTVVLDPDMYIKRG